MLPESHSPSRFPSMQYAPFLLQAFAARVLAAQQQAVVTRADLAKQGYDVEVLVEMIDAYGMLPEKDRGFVVTANDTEISIRRKPNTPAPVTPTNSVASPPVVAKGNPKPIFPDAQIRLADVVSRSSATNGKAASPANSPANNPARMTSAPRNKT